MAKNETTATSKPTPTQVAGAKSWKPNEVGDSISGVVLGFQVYTHDEYGKSPIVILDTEDDDAEGGRVRQVFVLGVLLSQFKEMGGVAKGDRYTVIYLGDEEGKRRTSKGEPISYHLYASYKGDAPALAESVNLEDFA